MSLKIIHVFVILLSIVLTLGFGFWALREYTVSKALGTLVWGGASSIVGLVLLPYLVWFIKKMRSASHE
jgi:predicted RND superfamily exporter protein